MEVPVKVLDATSLAVNSTDASLVKSQEQGIVNNKITFNPMEFTEVYKVMTELKTLDITLGSDYQEINGCLETWDILSYDATDLAKYDPTTLNLDEQTYTITYNLADKFGGYQEVDVDVVIMSREIVRAAEIEALYTNNSKVEIVPFANNGLGLPSTLTVVYEGHDGQEVLEEGTDYEWEIPDMTYYFGEGITHKDYTVYAVVGQGNFIQRLPVVYRVYARDPTGLKTIELNPYDMNEFGAVEMGNQQTVNFYNGEKNIDPMDVNVYFNLGDNIKDKFASTAYEIDGVNYMKDVSFTNPSFNRQESYYTNVYVYDEVFGGEILNNVCITIKTSQLTNMTFAEGTEFSQFYADEQLEAFLMSEESGITASIYGTSAKVDLSQFDIVSWRYFKEGGLYTSKENNYIVVTVGNNGYSADNAIWTQEIRVDLAPYLNDVTLSGVVYDYKAGTALQGFEINNPYEQLMDTTIQAKTTSGAIIDVPAKFAFDGNIYATTSVNGTITIAEGTNHYYQYEVTFYNTSGYSYGENGGITYFTSEDYDAGSEYTTTAINKFDSIVFPEYAQVVLYNENTSEYSYNKFDVVVTGYEVSDVVNGEFTLSVNTVMGSESFGYIEDTYVYTVTDQSIVAYDISDYIVIDPYKNNATIADQFADAGIASTMVVSVKTGASVAEQTLNSYYDITALNLDGLAQYDYNGYGVDIGAEWILGEEVVRSAQTISTRVTILERKAVGVDYDMTANIYEQIDFSELDEISVMFSNGINQVMHVDWDTTNLVYNFLGGQYTIYATITAGDNSTTQVFGVDVVVTPAELATIAVQSNVDSDEDVTLDEESVVLYDSNGQVTSLYVDPFEGFVGLPNKVYAYFVDVAEPILVSVDWNFYDAWNKMSIKGGASFGSDTNDAAIATIYATVDGQKTALQPIEIDIEVIDRTIQSYEAVYYGGELGASSADYSRLVSDLELNPYAVTAYTEKFNEEGFAFPIGIKLVVSDPDNGYKELFYDLSEDNYRIYDEDTGTTTSTKDLYKGRNVKAELNYGAINDTASKDAKIKTELTLDILDMTYESGLSTGYTVDPYGVKSEYYGIMYDDETEMYILTSDSGNIGGKMTATINTASGTSVEFKGDDSVVMDTQYVNVKIVNGRVDGEIGFGGGASRIYATFGTELGGYQRVSIPVEFMNRTIEDLFNGKALADSNLMYENYLYSGTFGEDDAVFKKAFIFDPFANQEGKFVTASDVVTFEGYDVQGNNNYGLESSFDQSDDSPLIVTWDASETTINYDGGDDYKVTATITSSTGFGTQVIEYNVVVLNRTAEISTDIMLDKDYVIQPYAYNESSNMSEEIAKDVFIGAGEKFTVSFPQSALTLEDGSTVLGSSISFTMGAEASYFKQDADVNNYAEDYDVDKLTLLSSAMMQETEENIMMQLVMDTARAVSYKGKDVAFYMVIPGFANGTDGQQVATFDVKCAEQYILYIECYDETTETYMTYLEWLWRKLGLTSITALESYMTQNMDYASMGNQYAYDISNVYYFISEGGLPVPDYVKVYVGEQASTGKSETYYKGAGEDLVTYEFEAESYWTKASNNNVRLSYNTEVVESSFVLELDNQSFKITLLVDPWILNSTVLFDDTATYGEEEVILLPTSSVISAESLSYLTVEDAGKFEDNMYTIVFQNGKEFVFSGITGGGTYNKNYNMWSFDDVNFSATGAIQSAKLTLGGRGGQEVTWNFNVSDKVLVGNSISTQYTVLYDVNEGSGESVTLPTTYNQLFSGDASTSNKEIAVTYSGMLNTDTSGEVAVGFKKSGNTVVPLGITPATPRSLTLNLFTNVFGGDDEESCTYADQAMAPGYVTWDATEARAYPSPKKSVGGEIYFIAYDSADSIITEDAYCDGPKSTKVNMGNWTAFLNHPDAFYGYSSYGINAGVDINTWSYAKGPSDGLTPSSTGTNYVLPDTGYAITTRWVNPISGANYIVTKQDVVPILGLKTGTFFDIRNLPTLTLRWASDEVKWDDSWAEFWTSEYVRSEMSWDYLYTVPWEDADVYYQRNSMEWRNDGNLASFGTKLSGGVNAIDTADSNFGRYTLVVNMNFGNGYAGTNETYQIIVAVDIAQ